VTITIEGELTDLNTYINAERTNRFIGAQLKRKETERVALETRAAKVPPVSRYPVTISFRWFSKDARKDIDNVAFAKKFILDGLVLAGVLQEDSRKHVAGFGSEEFYIDKARPRVEVSIATGTRGL
jgi:Holliday junction resolvase RusA-like endonuclease